MPTTSAAAFFLPLINDDVKKNTCVRVFFSDFFLGPSVGQLAHYMRDAPSVNDKSWNDETDIIVIRMVFVSPALRFN